MRFLKKIFSKKKNPKKALQEEERGAFMPPPDTPTDDKFILNFKANGGKFLYCLDHQDIQKTFQQILQENNWDAQSAYYYDQNIKQMFRGSDLDFTHDLEATFCVLSCEFLVANTGAILLSSNQIGEKKLSQLPQNCIVFAGTSQLIDSLGEGLRRIKARNEALPTNISTIKNFICNSEDEDDFMSYGSTSKNLYLLLLEDL